MLRGRTNFAQILPCSAGDVQPLRAGTEVHVAFGGPARVRSRRRFNERARDFGLAT